MTLARAGALVLGIGGLSAASPSFAQTPAAAAQTEGAITAIAAIRADERIELRVVAPQSTMPTLSEPFRTDDRSRLFLTFPDVKLALVEPPSLDPAGSLFAGLDIAERDGGVRIALDLTTLPGYGLATAGDTTILWLAQPTPANVAANAGSENAAPAATTPDDLAIARETAHAGWAAFRNDVGSAASAAASFATRAAAAIGGTAGGAWHATTRGVTHAASWLETALPFTAIARALALIALLVTPPAAAMRFLRRRPAAAKPHDAEIAGLEQHEAPSRREKPKRAPKQPKAQKPPKTSKLAVTHTTADARLWAARTLADSGADVAEIARQTGLSREAAILLVRRAQKR